ncbi:hypothetical protein DFH28DRAFT_1137112 [Melampsora americana]|nr:hypothetical protein DFH28DRAFT_1137112 [Melampsora americana]
MRCDKKLTQGPRKGIPDASTLQALGESFPPRPIFHRTPCVPSELRVRDAFVHLGYTNIFWKFPEGFFPNARTLLAFGKTQFITNLNQPDPCNSQLTADPFPTSIMPDPVINDDTPSCPPVKPLIVGVDAS